MEAGQECRGRLEVEVGQVCKGRPKNRQTKEKTGKQDAGRPGRGWRQQAGRSYAGLLVETGRQDACRPGRE